MKNGRKNGHTNGKARSPTGGAGHAAPPAGSVVRALALECPAVTHAPGCQLGQDCRHTRPHDLGVCVARPRLDVALGVEADADAVGDPSASSGPLPGRGL